MQSLAELAASMAQQGMFGNPNAGVTATQAARREDEPPVRPDAIAYDDWLKGAYGGKELSGMGASRKYYDNWANKYNQAGTGGRNALLKTHGLQFDGNQYQPGWGWRAQEGLEAMPGYTPSGNRSPFMALRDRGEVGQYGPDYGEPQDMIGPGGYFDPAQGNTRGLMGAYAQHGLNKMEDYGRKAGDYLGGMFGGNDDNDGWADSGATEGRPDY